MRQVVYNVPGPKRRPAPNSGERVWKGGKFFRAVVEQVPAFVLTEDEKHGATIQLLTGERRTGVFKGAGPDEYLEGASLEAAQAAAQEAEAARLEKEAAELVAKANAARAKLKPAPAARPTPPPPPPAK